MTTEEILSGGGLEFRARRPFAFGSEIAVLGGARRTGRRVMVASALGSDAGDEIEVERGPIEAGSVYVVWHCRRQGKESFACVALPVERVEEKTEEIERRIIGAAG